jgi:hypothetical protein
MRQFVSMPNIVRMMAEAGKLSEWVLLGHHRTE